VSEVSEVSYSLVNTDTQTGQPVSEVSETPNDGGETRSPRWAVG